MLRKRGTEYPLEIIYGLGQGGPGLAEPFLDVRASCLNLGLMSRQTKKVDRVGDCPQHVVQCDLKLVDSIGNDCVCVQSFKSPCDLFAGTARRTSISNAPPPIVSECLSPVGPQVFKGRPYLNFHRKAVDEHNRVQRSVSGAGANTAVDQAGWKFVGEFVSKRILVTVGESQIPGARGDSKAHDILHCAQPGTPANLVDDGG